MARYALRLSPIQMANVKIARFYAYRLQNLLPDPKKV